MLSFLTLQANRLQQDFSARFPGSWVVWEPGAWQAPAARGVMTTIVGGGANNTVPPPSNSPAVASTDSLCFGLKKESIGSQIRIGREPSNDIVLNDATVSRLHAVFTFQENGWNVEASAGRIILLSNRVVSEGIKKPLKAADAMVLGGAMLTFYDAPGFRARLEKTV